MGLVAKYPRPIRFLMTVSPRAVKAALANDHTAEDIDQACWLWAARAAKKFDPGRGLAFSTLATWYFRGALSRLAYQSDKSKPPGGSVLSLCGLYRDDGGDPEPFDPEDRRGASERPSPLAEWCSEEFRRQRACLHWRQRIILYLRAVEGMTLEEAGEAMGGLSRERVRQICDRAAEKMAKSREDRERRQATA